MSDSISLDSVQKLVVEWAPRDEDLIPLAMFKGGVSLATIRARWTLLQAMKDANVDSVTTICAISMEQREEAHFCGLHSATIRQHWQSMFSRITSAPTISLLDPHMVDYVRTVAAQSRMWVFQLDQISRTAFRSKWAWRKVARPVGMWVDRHIEIAQYPYIPKDIVPTHDHDLLLLAHKWIPKHFPPELRGDLCQDLIVEMLTGEIDPNELGGQLQPFIKRSLRKYPRKYDGISMESKFDGDDLTFGQRLSWEGVNYA